MKIAVIIPTYNQPDRLAAVLDGYFAQDDTNFELIVADDGSTDETRELVAAYMQRSLISIQHVWQEDRGFRLAAVRNRGIAATQAEYVIQTDGDCVPPPYFVSRHRRLAQQGRFLAGNRILLSDSFTRQVLEEHLPIHEWTAAQWKSARRNRDINRYLPMVHLPLGLLRLHSSKKWKGCKTCNLSCFRADLVKVNGFDESYSGWGMEDSDLVIRLIRSGVMHKSARFAAPVFHLWHRENDRSQLPENQQRLQELLASRQVRAQLGLDQYTSA